MIFTRSLPQPKIVPVAPARPDATDAPDGPVATETLEALRARIRRLERRERTGAGPEWGREPGAVPLGVPFGVPLGVAEIDAHLPEGGLRRGALHEIVGAEDGGAGGGFGADGAASLFAASVLARLSGRLSGPVLWCHGGEDLFPDLFPPGLAGVGLAPERVIHVAAGAQTAVLLAMEEGLREPGVAGVIGEVRRLSMLASRRLALAAEAGGGLGLALLRGAGKERAPSAAVTRWRVRPVPSSVMTGALPGLGPGLGLGLGPALWRLDLLRCRGAEAASWVVEAPDAAGRLGLAAVLPDRPAAAGWAGRAGRARVRA